MLRIAVFGRLSRYFERKLEEEVTKNLPWIAERYAEDIAHLLVIKRTNEFFAAGAELGMPLTPDAVLKRITPNPDDPIDA